MASPTTQQPFQRALLTCGVLSSLVYAVTDVVGALSYPRYGYAAQAISEMSAIGAPTAKFLAPFYATFSALFLAFAAGVWREGSSRRALRWSAGFLLGVAVLGIGFSIFPMNPRGVERTLSDTMHLLIAGATMGLLSGAIVCGMRPFGLPFRRYSAGTVIVMLAFFGLTLLDAPNLAADRPTPFMGLNERICMTAWLLWIAVFSMRLRHAALPAAPRDPL